MVECMVFLRRPGQMKYQEGLGKHPFGRIPCVGEYVSLGSNGPNYKVVQVHHSGFSDNHVAELHVIETEDTEVIAVEHNQLD